MYVYRVIILLKYAVTFLQHMLTNFFFNVLINSSVHRPVTEKTALTIRLNASSTVYNRNLIPVISDYQ